MSWFHAVYTVRNKNIKFSLLYEEHINCEIWRRHISNLVCIWCLFHVYFFTIWLSIWCLFIFIFIIIIFIYLLFDCLFFGVTLYSETLSQNVTFLPGYFINWIPGYRTLNPELGTFYPRYRSNITNIRRT